MYMQTFFRKRENKRAHLCGERLTCRKYDKNYDVFNVAFKMILLKFVIEEHCNKRRMTRAILKENARNHHVLHVLMLKGVA